MKIRLIDIAHARSGDKGDTGNVGVIARKVEYYPVLVKYLTVDRVKKHFEGIAFCVGRGHGIHRRPEPRRVLHQRRDVVEQDPRFRKVGDMTYSFL